MNTEAWDKIRARADAEGSYLESHYATCILELLDVVNRQSFHHGSLVADFQAYGSRVRDIEASCKRIQKLVRSANEGVIEHRMRIEALEAKLTTAAPCPGEPVAAEAVNDKTNGLYQKYRVERVDGSSGPGGKHERCEYFVLDLSHDPHAIPAIRAYAASCKADYPALAEDLGNIAPHDAPATKPDYEQMVGDLVMHPRAIVAGVLLFVRLDAGLADIEFPGGLRHCVPLDSVRLATDSDRRAYTGTPPTKPGQWCMVRGSPVVDWGGFREFVSMNKKGSRYCTHSPCGQYIEVWEYARLATPAELRAAGKDGAK